MSLDFSNAVDSESGVRIRDEFSDEVLGGRGEVSLRGDDECSSPVKNFLAGDLRVVGEEGWVAYEHLVEDDSDTPEVDRLSIALLPEDFRGDIVWGSYSRESKLGG